MNKNVFQTGIRLSLCAAIPGCLLWPLSGLALTVNVNSSAPITQQVAPELRKANQTLSAISETQNQIGAAINANGDKLAAMIEQSTQAIQTQETFARQTERLETARRNFAVPETLCTESASGSAVQVSQQARATQGALKSGSGISGKLAQAY
ncbi:conjugal transfer protein TraW, partial [Escherichia coli]